MTLIDEPKETEPPVTVLYPALHGLEKLKKAELIALIEQMATDWRTLNGIHNHTAEHRDWCSDYEERQRMHNKRFGVLRLMGRSDNRLIGRQVSGL